MPGWGETGAVGPIPAVHQPTRSPPLTLHDAARIVGDAGHDVRAIRRWLAGGRRWARWNRGLKQGDLGATGVYRKPREIHTPKAAGTLVSEWGRSADLGNGFRSSSRLRRHRHLRRPRHAF